VLDLDEPELGYVLQDALDGYDAGDAEDLDEALEAVLDEMSPAEAFNFGKALRTIQSATGKAALPAGAAALGTVIGGPAGTALGSRLGTAAAKALPGRPKTPPVTIPPVAGGSAAAAQGLVLTQQPDVLQALLALALGEHGRKSVNGVPVAAVMNMLSSVFGQAAADADELLYLGDSDGESDPPIPGDRSLYVALIDADNEELS
jgi:hypothetical protein